MLIQFKVKNFLSFKDEVIFSLEAQSLKDRAATNTFDIPVSNQSLLKTAAIYGPNGSGKSNLIKALEFVVGFIRNSAKEMQAEEEIPVTRFKLSTLTEYEPSCFQIEILVGDVKYRYGFEVTSEEVKSEWLYLTKKFKEYQLFKRDGKDFDIDSKYSEGEGIDIKTRENALFLSAVAQWNGPISISIIESLKKIRFFNDVLDFRDFRHTARLMEDSAYRNRILEFLKSADLGIEDIKTESVDLDPNFVKMFNPSVRKKMFGHDLLKTIKTKHLVYDKDNVPISDVYLDLVTEESLGTQKIFALAGPIIEALSKGNVLVMDEFTARLHPMLSRFIVKKFNSLHNTAAQLIFASHNFGLMERELFRRDQIFLARKGPDGATSISSFYDVHIRHDASFRGKYFSGEFGGVPKIKPDDGKGQQDLFDM